MHSGPHSKRLSYENRNLDRHINAIESLLQMTSSIKNSMYPSFIEYVTGKNDKLVEISTTREKSTSVHTLHHT